VLVSGTDGVGTKLRLAFDLDRHETIGIDLVAMCVNDVITTGARPLFFLDYLATAKLDVEQATSVVRGIAEGCRIAGCALLGGETAEMPGFYARGEYDVAGFAVGVVERAKLIDGRDVRPGDVVVGLASSGPHSNGFSLIRKALFERAGMSPHAVPDGFASTLGDILLEPTRIYVAAVRKAIATVEVRAVCHVTGGGLLENLPRVLPRGTRAEIDGKKIPTPAVFGLIERAAEIPRAEMWRTFNMGIGLALVVPAAEVPVLVAAMRSLGEHPFECGVIVAAENASSPATAVLCE
jgi:phosphoribosylformylglycinamidine cyclo-ligase